jgi:hypothetical protein
MAHANLIDASNAAALQAPRSRRGDRVLVINDDGFGNFFTGRVTTAEALRQQILVYRDTQVAVLEWCVTSGSRVNYPSRVSELLGDGVEEFPRRGDRLASETLQRLVREGVDTLQVVGSACREVGMLCYASLRMNGDYNANWMGECLPRQFNSRFWWTHPELRVRGPKGEDRTKLSYAFPEVRRFKLALLREVAEREIDGVNLDTLRHPPFFGYEEPLIAAFQERHGADPRDLPADDPRWLALCCELMTEFVRSARALLDAAGQQKGRRLGLSARVDWREYRAWGCDIESWLREGLLDYLVIAQHTLGGYEFDLTPFVAMAKGTGCAVYFGEEAITSGHDLTPEEDRAVAEGRMKPPERDHLSLEQYRARARRWYAMGADGVHLFNDQHNLPVLRVLGDRNP